MAEQVTEVKCKDCGTDFTLTKGEIALLNFLSFRSHFNTQCIHRCPKCKNKAIKAANKEEAATRQLEIARQRLSWRTGSGIPLKFMSEEFGTWEFGRPGNVDKAHKLCLKYAEGFPIDYSNYREKTKKAYPSLILMSPGSSDFPQANGLGKSHLVCSIIHKVLNRWKGEGLITEGEGVTEKGISPVKFITEPELFKKIQATYSYSNEDRQRLPSEAAIIRKLISVPLLIIDDIGKEQRKEMMFVQRTLFSIINERYNNMRPVVLTANLDQYGLRDYLRGDKPNSWKTVKERGLEQPIKLDNASLDRLIEMCGVYFFKMTGESYRRR